VAGQHIQLHVVSYGLGATAKIAQKTSVQQIRADSNGSRPIQVSVAMDDPEFSDLTDDSSRQQ
jgi:hypothetical protein